MKRDLELHRCCICGQSFCGYGHNPYPIKERGVCCDKCNELTVLKRLQLLKRNHK